MPLSDEQKQALRDEEFFREQVRKELAGPKKAQGLLERISAFLETKAGFWLLTTVLAGLAATGMAELQRYLDKDRIEKREKADRLRRDTDTLLKLGPMLASEKPAEANLALVLLCGLMSNEAIDREIADQVHLLFTTTERAGAGPNATKEAQQRAEAASRCSDRARLQAIAQAESPAPEPAPEPAKPSAVTTVTAGVALPPRVYLQVASEADRTRAEQARAALRGSGIIAPGIEVVPARSVPQANELRYCPGKIDADAVQRVQTALGSSVKPEPQERKLSDALCGNVRFNHFELWYARSGG